MPVLRKTPELVLWRTTEPLEELLSLLPAFLQVPAYKAQSRLTEWAAVHVAVHELTGAWQQVCHLASGKPYLENEGRSLSISHTRGVVAVSLTPDPCGIDVEYCSERAAKIRDRFMGKEEGFAGGGNPSLEATLCWSAKEAVYKVLENQEAVDFRKHLPAEAVPCAPQGKFAVHDRRSVPPERYEVSFELFPDFVFTRAIRRP